MDTFEWMNFPEGRARFSGGVRGFDELGHETFCIQINKNEFFGKFGKIWKNNETSYQIEIISFGYRDPGDVGLNSKKHFNYEESQKIKLIIEKLINVGLNYTNRPFLISDPNEYKFLGIVFRDEWIEVK